MISTRERGPMEAPGTAGSKAIITPARRCACGGIIRSDGLCDRCSRSLRKQRASSAGPSPAIAPPIVHEVLSGQGRALPMATQRFARKRLGYDFGSVRVHTDARAAESARAVGASAYTVGRHVVFGAGRFAPQSEQGAWLLQHELAHVVQQRSRPWKAGAALKIGAPGDAYEREADRAADHARSALSSAPVSVQRQLITPLGQGGGFGGLMERDRQRAYGPATSGGTAAAPATPFQVCARDLQGVLGHVGNHAYIEAPPNRYAIISPLCPSGWSDNPVTGTTAQKWDNSPDPCGKAPRCVACLPAPGVTDVGACLRSAFTAYSSLSLYRALGPNSNTFAGTLARACCAGMVPKPAALGNCPGWGDPPAPARAGGTPCPPGPTC